MIVDCNALPGHLAAICRGEHRKGDGRYHTLEERKQIVSRILGVAVIEVELPATKAYQREFSGIGDRLQKIIAKAVGQIPCGECKDEIILLNFMSTEKATEQRDALANRIVARAQKHGKKWWQRWGATLAPGFAKQRVLSWIDEAIGNDAKLVQIQEFKSPPLKQLDWAYGVTAVKSRLDDGILERTLASLNAAGFDRPRLFVDGNADGFERLGLDMTQRTPVIRSYGNWLLGLLELYFRQPYADRYAMFQDDFVTYPNLRVYLDNIEYKEKGYWNLYTFPHNQPDRLSQRLMNGKKTHPDLSASTTGFYPACQNGKGAVALVFDNQAVKFLLSRSHMIERVQNEKRGHKAIDGGVVEAMRQEGWTEYVHNPSLVQHIGDVSSMGNRQHLKAVSFKGENFDAKTLLNRVV